MILFMFAYKGNCFENERVIFLDRFPWTNSPFSNSDSLPHGNVHSLKDRAARY